MKKIIVRVAIGLVLLIVLALVIVFFSLNSIVKKGVETIGPQLTKVEVRLGGVQLSPLSGSGRLTKMFVGNPEGYKTESAIKVGDVKVAVSIGSLLSDTIVVNEVNIQEPEITFEGGLSGSNLGKILDNLDAAAGEGGEKPAKEAGAKGQKYFYVKDVVVKGGKVHVSITGLSANEVIVPLPAVHFQNIGTKDQGVTAAEMSKQILSGLLVSVTKAVAESGGDVGKALKNLRGDTGKQVEDVTQGLKGLFKGSSQTATNK